ncbi:MAG TPA: LamG-like jellyroll fold domain-containing protein [Tepidisphaeraceae bacterium]|nr:LamG-like jellyroll fold domain-containing protein [Tepidisphaeraceae bacterium]
MAFVIAWWLNPAGAGVVGYWNLNEGYNSDGTPVQEVLDSSGNGRHGFLGFNDTIETVDAPRSLDAQGRSGTSGDYALSYPVGVNVGDFAGIPHQAGVFTPPNFTLAADIDPSTFRQSVVAGKHGGGTTGSYFLGFSGTNAVETNNFLRFVVITVDNSTGTPVYTRVNLDTPILASDGDPGYHQFVGTYDGAAMRLYYDGVLRAEAAQTGPVRDVNRRVLFGDYSDYNQNSFEYEGLVDNPALFDTALSDGGVAVGQAAAPGSEIHQLYTQGAASFVPEPASLAVVGLAGLMMLRRRTRA